MNKTAKALLIPVAAFAVTATGVSAFNSEVLQKAGLNETQIAAFVEARELREEGDRDGARDVLAEAGIDVETMQSVRQVVQEQRKNHHTALEEAVENNDYEAFLLAAEGSPLADIITSEEDFALFVRAHELREEANDIMAELGLPEKGEGHGAHMRHMMGGFKHGHHEDEVN